MVIWVGATPATIEKEGRAFVVIYMVVIHIPTADKLLVGELTFMWSSATHLAFWSDCVSAVNNLASLLPKQFMCDLVLLLLNQRQSCALAGWWWALQNALQVITKLRVENWMLSKRHSECVLHFIHLHSYLSPCTYARLKCFRYATLDVAPLFTDMSRVCERARMRKQPIDMVYIQMQEEVG